MLFENPLAGGFDKSAYFHRRISDFFATEQGKVQGLEIQSEDKNKSTMIKNVLLLILGSCISSAFFWANGECFVGPTAVISVDHCNWLYAGIDNPITILAKQDKPVALDQVVVEGGTIRGKDGHFIVRADSVYSLDITVKTAFGDKKYRYDVKPIGPVEPLLGAKHQNNATVSVEEFKAQGGIAAVINCCGFDAKCDMVSFLITRLDGKGKTIMVENKGARFAGEAKALIFKAESGNIYRFTNIISHCPGDLETRYLHDLTINII